MTSMETTAISDAIHARIFDQKKPVTARWICYEHMCNMCTAQMLLQQILNNNASSVTVTRLIDGECKDSGHRKVSMVSEEKAQQLRDAMSNVISDQIYGVAPVKGAADPTSLVSADVEQARVMMTALLSNTASEQAQAFADNACSMVKGTPCPRKLGPPAPAAAGTALPPRPKAQSAPAREGAQPAKAPAAAPGSLKTHAKAASVAAAAVKTETFANEQPRQAAPKSSAAAPAAKKGGALASSFGKAPPKKPKAEAAPAKKQAAAKDEPVVKPEAESPAPPVAKKAEAATALPAAKRKGKAQILDSDDEEEKRSSSESPLPSRPLQAKRPAQIIEDDSDDDFAAPAKPATKSAAESEQKPKVEKMPAKRAKSAPAKAAKASKPQVDKQQEAPQLLEAEAEEPAPAPPAQKPAAVEVMSDRSNHQAASTREHPEYGTPPHPDAEITMVAISKTAKVSKAAPVKQEVTQAKRPQPDTQNAGTAAPEKPAKKTKASGKNAKAAAGAADIRSMFGKK